MSLTRLRLKENPNGKNLLNNNIIPLKIDYITIISIFALDEREDIDPTEYLKVVMGEPADDLSETPKVEVTGNYFFFFFY